MPPKFFSREQLVGKQVVDARGTLVGSVRDIAIGVGDEKPEVALAVSREGQDVVVPMAKVAAVGDVILLKEALELPSRPASVAPGSSPPSSSGVAAPSSAPPAPAGSAGLKACPRCAHQNKTTAKFCVRCGYPLPT